MELLRRLLRLCLVLAAILPVAPALAVPTQREIALRFGLTPEQSAAVFTRVDRQDRQITDLSSANGIKTATLRAIALELGARNPNLSAEQFIALIEARAGDAAKAQARIGELDKAVAALDPGGDRSRAVAVLQRARAAFEGGRLQEAEAAFAELSLLRASELVGARKAWLHAMGLQAESAFLRGDMEAMDRIMAAKSAELARQQREAQREQWKSELQRATYWQTHGDKAGNNDSLRRAIMLYREAVLPLSPRDQEPLDWATTQNDLGVALATLGERESGAERLEQAVAAYRFALEVFTRESAPINWAMAQSNLSNALLVLGWRAGSKARLEEALTAARAALLELSRTREPTLWATTQTNVGSALHYLGAREAGTARLVEAATAFRIALLERKRERTPKGWAETQNNLGNALRLLGEREGSAQRLEESAAAFRNALLELGRDREPLDWAATKANLGDTLQALGWLESGTGRLQEAEAAYRAALLERTRERVPLGWAATQNNLGNTLAKLGAREMGTARLEEAVATFHAALLERTRERVPLDWAETQNNLGLVLRALGLAGNQTEQLKASATAFRSALLERSRDRAPLEWGITTFNLAVSEWMLAWSSGQIEQFEAIRERALAARQVGLDGGYPALVAEVDRFFDYVGKFENTKR